MHPLGFIERLPFRVDGDIAYGPGIYDMKGGAYLAFYAYQHLVRQGKQTTLPITFMFVPEEEIGSPFFGAFTERHRDLLAADVVIITDGPKHATGRPTIAGGARGVGKIELELEAARRDVHSGNFAVPNPAWKLNGLLASMATPDGVPLIEGFEADVVPPSAAEKAMMAALPMDLAAMEKDLGVKVPSDYLDRIMFHPTLTIRGLHSGFLGKEANTIIPHKATVLLEVRLVRNMRWPKVVERVLDHIRGQGFTVIDDPVAPLPDELRGKAVRVVSSTGYDPAKTSL